MNWNKQINLSSEFCVTFTSKDKQRFTNAFGWPRANPPERITHDRIWVSNVMAVAANIMGVQKSQIIHAFFTGRIDALHRAMYKRDIYLQDVFRTIEPEDNSPKTIILRKVLRGDPCWGAQHMTMEAFRDAFRKAIDFGLGCRHASDRAATRGDSEEIDFEAAKKAHEDFKKVVRRRSRQEKLTDQQKSDKKIAYTQQLAAK
jgi:hypothetical protein